MLDFVRLILICSFDVPIVYVFNTIQLKIMILKIICRQRET